LIDKLSTRSPRQNTVTNKTFGVMLLTCGDFGYMKQGFGNSFGLYVHAAMKIPMLETNVKKSRYISRKPQA